MEVYTIGYAQVGAAEFFGKLSSAKIVRLIDVRLRNSSQLAGFAKRDDLKFFLSEICGIEYVHEPRLAPTREMLNAYKKEDGSWEEYERQFGQLMVDRQIESVLDRALFDAPTALLCSERSAERCHRRLILEHLRRTWGGIEPVHL
jgi:uncharacterized protein (DUF488 family)